MTHDEAQRAACAWLLHSRHAIAWDEATWGDVRLDAVGLGVYITAVEVKVSRSDYLKDFGDLGRRDARLAKWTKQLAAADREASAALAALKKAAKAAGRDDQPDWMLRGMPEYQLHIDAMRARNRLARGMADASARGTKAARLIDMGVAHRYVVCVPRGLIEPDEVPPGWGLIVATNRYGASVIGRIPKHPVPEEWRKRAAWLRRAAASCSWRLHRMVGDRWPEAAS